MRCLKLITHSLLLITTPSLIAYRQDPAPFHKVSSRKLKKNFREKERYHLLTYDEILTLLDDIGSGEAEKKYRPKDLKRINNYLAYLADEGKLSNYTDSLVLQEDIEDLLSDDEYEFVFALGGGEEYSIIPAVFDGDTNIYNCGLSKKWRKAKRFVRRHRKEIIIGVVVVVALTIVVVAVVANAPVATAIAGAAGAAASSQANKAEKNELTSKESAISPPIPSVDTLSILEATEDAPVLGQRLMSMFLLTKIL